MDGQLLLELTAQGASRLAAVGRVVHYIMDTQIARS